MKNNVFITMALVGLLTQCVPSVSRTMTADDAGNHAATGVNHAQTVFKSDTMMYQARLLNDSTVVYTHDNNLYLWNYKGDGPATVLSGHTDSVHDYDFSPDRKRIVSSSADGTLRLWDVETARCLATSMQLDTKDQPYWSMLHDVVYSLDGERIISADMTGYKVWRTSDLKLLFSEESDAFYMCCGLVAPDMETYCAPFIPPLSMQGFAIYEPRAGDTCLLRCFKDYYPWCYSPDGKRLLTVVPDTGQMHIWIRNTKAFARGKPSIKMKGAPEQVTCAEFSGDGTLIVTAHASSTVRIWNAETGSLTEALRWPGHRVHSVCFGPGGSHVLAVCEATCEICIWELFR